MASQRGLPRTAGHRAGAKAVDKVVEAAARHGIATLSLYTVFPQTTGAGGDEVGALFALLRRYLLTQTPRCLEQSIRINVIGRRDRLGPEVLRTIEHSERATAHCAGCGCALPSIIPRSIRYWRAARRMAAERGTDRARFVERLADVDHSIEAPDVDLLIRTGGEKRLSDFLLWECAYAELHFVECFWRRLDAAAFAHAIDEYGRRERRFGQVSTRPEQPAQG